MLAERAWFPFAVLFSIFPPPRPTVISLIVASPHTTSSLAVGVVVPIPTLPQLKYDIPVVGILTFALESDEAVVAVAALPVILIPHVPDAQVPVRDGA